MKTPNANAQDTIHALIPSTLKQSVKDFCHANDINESQLIRRALNLVLTKARQS
jgi:hypothetical protein